MTRNTVLEVNDVSKYYKRGDIGFSSFARDLRDLFLNEKQEKKSQDKQLANDSDSRERGIWAVNSVSLKAQRGDVIGLLGHNGSGKTTLLKLISRITAPTLGKISYKGRIASLLEVGVGFHPELSGRENIYLNGAILGVNKKAIDSDLESIVSFAGLSNTLDTPVKRYSSGMLVRLAFSIVIHIDLNILIVDEVLAVSDAEFREKCVVKIQSAAKRGCTILIVSHNINLIESLCNRGIVMEKGGLIYDGNIKEAIACYLESKPSNL